MKAYPPFTGRFQPFGKVGLGVQHSKLEIDIVSAGLEATDNNETNPVPADFRIRKTNTKLDGMLHLGAGIDIYATPNIVAEFGFNFATPFRKVGSILGTDYVTIQSRLIYRF